MTLRIVFKAALLFVLCNLIFAWANPVDSIGQISIYNWLMPGRSRLPYGEQAESYNLSLNSLPAMFASHEIARPKADDEFRVLLLGDSSVWGVLLRPEATLSGQLNALGLRTDDGKQVRAYNLGHPILSVTKDLMILDYAMRYQPDLIVWLVTLDSLAPENQIGTATDGRPTVPLVWFNAERIRLLFAEHDLDYGLPSLPPAPDLLERSIVGQRRALADWLRLQLYGVMWGSTGIDQVYAEYERPTNDFDEDLSWQAYDEPQPLDTDDLAFDVIAAGHAIAGSVPVLLVNEPIYISDGANSDLRYNFWYPRWAYDNYLETLRAAAEQDWQLVDLWNAIDAEEFTDSPVHISSAATGELAAQLGDRMLAGVGATDD